MPPLTSTVSVKLPTSSVTLKLAGLAGDQALILDRRWS